MKYLKTYEKLTQQEELNNLKVDDWVFLTHWWAGQHLHDFIDNTPCRIIDIKYKEYQHVKLGLQYTCEYLENPMNKEEEIWIKDFTTIIYNRSGVKNIEDWVKRKATKKEAKEYQIKTDSKKYNL